MCVVTLACIRFRSPCEDADTRIEDKKAGARKTMLELEEELMKKYAEGARKRKDKKDALNEGDVEGEGEGGEGA